MKRKILLISIQIVIVAIVLALTVTAYAWFVSQTTVTATETEITAAAGANAAIEKEELLNYESYMGQTGLGDPNNETRVDCPYVVRKKLTMSLRPISDDTRLTAKIVSMEVQKTTGEKASSETNADILGYFTWRMEIGGVEYGPDENGFAYRLDESGQRVYYTVTEEVSVEIIFRLVYLDEASYANYLRGNTGAGHVTQFAYCGYDNMRAVFTCAFEIGLDVPKDGGGGETA